MPTKLLSLALAFCCIAAFQPAKSQVIYAVQSGNLISFNATSPGTVTAVNALTGITAGQSIEGLDFRPANGQLYALGYNSATGNAQLYTINTATAGATAVGSAITLATGMQRLSFDFNPVVDRIRVTSSTGNNYRLNPLTGGIAATDAPLNYVAGDPHFGASPGVNAVAYTNSYANSVSTTLYYYDINFNSIGIMNPPNSGALNTVASTGLAPLSAAGLDIDIMTDLAASTNTAYLTANTTGTASSLYTINLTTGAPTLLGVIGGGFAINDMAVSIPAAPPIPSYAIYAVQAGNLIKFNSTNPSSILTSFAITGISAGQTIEGLDVRPANGQLYALGYNAATGDAQLYTINTANGAATPVGSAITLATGMARLSFDFNPIVDRIRVTSYSGHNYRLNPLTGGIAATDAFLAYAAGDVHAGASPGVEAVAYSNNYVNGASTTLYFFDSAFNNIGYINPPNNGTLNTVASTGIPFASGNGLDMDIVTEQSTGNTAFISVNTSGSTNNLYVINLNTGLPMLAGTIGGGTTINDMAIALPAATPPQSYTIYALQSGNLIGFNSSSPSNILKSVAVTGVSAGQTLEGLDFRPANGQLYALGYNSTTGDAQLYTINLTTGAATAVASAFTLATGMQRLSFDFNPAADRIRVTSSAGHNYRLNPLTGGLAATDAGLAYASGDVHFGAAPAVNTVAYINSYSGAATTSLYYYDFSFNSIGIMNPPNSGALNTVAATGLAPLSANGLDMDIVTDQATSTHTAFLSANTSGTANSLYTVDLNTGLPLLLGTIGSGAPITELAVQITGFGLPVKLDEFTVRKSGHAAELSWTTQTEINNDHFIIERRTANGNYVNVSGKINSKAFNGNSTLPLRYNFTDASPATGVNYYRLVQVDKDAQLTYSKVLAVNFDGKYEITLHPNPVKDVLNMNGYLPANGNLQYKLLSAQGAVLVSGEKRNANGNWNGKLNVTQLAAGMYYLQVWNNGSIIYSAPVYKN